MKTNYATSKVETQGNFETRSFKFAESAKVFRILSDGLYSDKLGSIVREIICNGFDSHVQAGKREEPVEVYLPTTVDPNFKIIDRGVGLSVSEVYDIYTTYGATTKDESNSVIGAFGLGSKSPFSYTETFALTAAKDGTESFYTAYIDEDGYPKISHMGSHGTDKCDGVMVTIPIKERDFDELRNKTLAFLRNAISPATLNGSKVERHVDDVVFQATNASIVKRRRRLTEQLTVRMGDVVYPITEGDVLECFDDDDKKSVARAFLNKISYNSYGIAFNVNIGDIEVSSSRESVAFTKRTASVIREAAWNVIKSYRQESIDALSKTITSNKAWDARINGTTVLVDKFHNFFTDIEISSHRKKLPTPYMPWTKFANDKLGLYVFGNGRRTANLMLGGDDSLLGKSGMTIHADEIRFAKPSANYLFFFETKAMRRNLGDLSEYFALNHPGKRIIYVTPVSKLGDEKAMYNRFVRRAKRNLGLADKYIINDIVVEKAAPKAKTSYSGWKAQVFAKKEGYTSWQESKYYMVAKKIEDPEYFDGKLVAPRAKSGRVMYTDGFERTGRDIMENVEKIFGPKIKLVVLPPTVYKKLEEQGAFKKALNLVDAVNFEHKRLYSERMIHAGAIAQMKTNFVDNISSWACDMEGDIEDEFFYKVDDRDFVEAFGMISVLGYQHYGASKLTTKIDGLMRSVDRDTMRDYRKLIEAKEAELQKVLDRYPMLASLCGNIADMGDYAAEYINFKYSQRSQQATS